MTNTTPGAGLSDRAIAQAFREGKARLSSSQIGHELWIEARAREIESTRELPAASLGEVTDHLPVHVHLIREGEQIGSRCLDGGTCHHSCTKTCARKTGCVPLSIAESFLNDDWTLKTQRAESSPALDALATRVEALLTDWGDSEMREERDRIAADIRSLATPTPSTTGSGDAVEPTGWYCSDVRCCQKNSMQTNRCGRCNLVRGDKGEPFPPATPSDQFGAGEGVVGNVLRTLLAERSYRTDGDVLTLAKRCYHLSREDATLIDMRQSIIDTLDKEVATLAAKAEGDGGEDDGSSAFAKGREVFWKQRRSERSSKEAEAAFDEYHRKLKATTQATQP